MKKIIPAVSTFAIAWLHVMNLAHAHDRHQVPVEMFNGKTLKIDMDEWAITSLLDMDFALDEMKKVAAPSNPYTREVQLYRLRSASAVLRHKSNIFNKMAISAAEGTGAARTRMLYPCNLALQDIDKKISNIVSVITEEKVVFDQTELDQTFGKNIAHCFRAIKHVN
tara:strand:- start:8424 stop:8924 length:501 start_codon:yes stop_codon:yes gene_type:complete